MSMNKLLAAFAAVAFAFGIGAVQAADDTAKTEPAAADAKPADAAAPAAAPAEKK